MVIVNQWLYNYNKLLVTTYGTAEFRPRFEAISLDLENPSTTHVKSLSNDLIERV